MRGDSGKPAKAAKEVNMPDTEMKWTMPGPDSTIARLLLWFQMSSHEGGGASFRLPSLLLPAAWRLLYPGPAANCQTLLQVRPEVPTPFPIPCPHTSAVSITHTYKLTPALSSARCSYPSSLTCGLDSHKMSNICNKAEYWA